MTIVFPKLDLEISFKRVLTIIFLIAFILFTVNINAVKAENCEYKWSKYGSCDSDPAHTLTGEGGYEWKYEWKFWKCISGEEELLNQGALRDGESVTNDCPSLMLCKYTWDAYYCNDTCTAGWKCNAEGLGDDWKGYQSSNCSWSSVYNCKSSDGYVGVNYCYDNGVYRDYRNYYCSEGSCEYSTTSIKQEDCQYGCENGACNPSPEIIIEQPEETEYSYTDGPLDIIYTITDEIGEVVEIIVKLDDVVYESSQIFLDQLSIGLHKLEVLARDSEGNWLSSFVTFNIIDDISPVINLIISGLKGENDWYISDVTVTLNATDEKSNITAIDYSLDNNTSINYTEPIQLNNTTIIYNYTSRDSYGNYFLGGPAAIKIDKNPPVTTDNSPGTWQNSDFTVTLTATDDNSGVANTAYRVDSGNWTNGTLILIDTEGNHTIEYYSKDIAGNEEDVKTTYAALDKTPPVTTDNAPGGWINANSTITLNVSDNLSGISATYYKINDADFTQGISIVLDTDGLYNITYYSVDNAGNNEPENSAQVKIDQTPPNVSLWLDPAQDSYPTNESLPVQYTAEDPLVNGVASNNLTLVWDIDGTNVSDPTNISEWAGTHTLKLTATDLAGNSNSAVVNFTGKLVLIGEHLLKITPEVLEVNPGILTVHLNLTGFYNSSEILSGICDYAEHDNIANHNIKFRREDIEKALEEQNQTLDIHFEVNGTALYNGYEIFFEGWDNITEILD